MKKQLLAIVTSALLASPIANASVLMKPTPIDELTYEKPMLIGDYSSTITHPDEILGFPVGSRVASSDLIEKAINLWATQSDRIKVVEYARSHENRPLHAVFISTPEILSNRENIKANLAKLADPRNTSESNAKDIIDNLPAVAWMAYSIHGNETSGADAALMAMYHLLADQSQATTDLLDNMLVVIDPIMNPDGRDRFAKSLEQYRGTAPNVDDQALLHRGDWPYGRANHYLFDLNRDFFYLTQPETKGRVELINEWKPQLMIDGHEMGPQDTYLMGPPRQPLNFNIAPSVQKWAKTFAVDQGAAFDDNGWQYYTGEWFENWYPGYSNYAEYRGAVHILYEQSRMAEDGVRRPEGTIQTYIESVHHQYVSTIANLETLDKHSKAMYQDFWSDRKSILDKDSQFADKTYVIPSIKNHSRLALLAEKLLAQDIEVRQLSRNTKLDDVTNHLGKTQDSKTFAKGSLVINARQPEARILSAIMEFDAGIKPEVLQEERASVLRDGSSIMYDTTAWNLTMMYGLEAFTVDDEISKNTTDYVAPANTVNNQLESANFYVVDGADDRSVAFAARLLEQDVQVRVIDIESEFNGQKFSRGSVAVTVTDNPKNAQLTALVSETANELGVEVKTSNTGLGDGDLPDWGGRHFNLLTKPQIAIATQSGTSSLDAGTVWWSIDTNLGVRHSHLDGNSLGAADLRRYNVIVLPHRWSLSSSAISALHTWVKQGGTLIAHDNAARIIARHDGFTDIQELTQSFDNAEDMNIALQRRLMARDNYVIDSSLTSSSLATNASYPWDNAQKSLKKSDLEKRDKWQSMFMPRGAMVAGHADQKHWLTFGTPETLPLLYRNQTVLVTPQGAESVVDVGIYANNPKVEHPETALSWYSLPNGKELHLRMSGLLWPEAQQRIANSSYLARESVGRGQVILFSGQPNFRGAAVGTNRLLLNAIVYGPGMGTRKNIEL